MRLFALIFFGIVLTCCHASDVSAVSADKLKIAINSAIGYIHRNCDVNGQFTYMQYLDSRKVPYKYNLLRHSGTVYALKMAYDRGYGVEKSGEVISKANEFLSRFIMPLGLRPEASAVWTIPEKLNARAAKGAAISAKLGGAGLGVMALRAEFDLRQRSFSEKERVEFLKKVRALGAFILFMQQPDGSFHSKYIPQIGYDPRFVSLYYPGEAILALVNIFEITGDEKYLKAADHALSFLCKSRAKSGKYPADHWVLIATEAFWRNYPQLSASRTSLDLLVLHSTTIIELMLSQQILHTESPDYGSFRLGGQTCPTAIRVEGMLAAMKFLADNNVLTDDLEHKILQSTGLAVSFLVKSQVKEGELEGGIPRSIRKLPLVMPEAKSNNRRSGEVRIDYVQHALSAFVLYEQLCSP